LNVGSKLVTPRSKGLFNSNRKGKKLQKQEIHVKRKTVRGGQKCFDSLRARFGGDYINRGTEKGGKR